MEEVSQYDLMTKTPVSKLIIKLGIPTTISMLVTGIYNMADTAFVGRINTSASGAIGVSFGFMAIVQAFGFMFGQGSGSLLARKLGEKDRENASKFATTGFCCSLISGLLIAILGFIFFKPMIYFLGSSDTIYPYAYNYLKFILVAAPFMTAGCTLNNILRYQGKASLAMIGLMSGGILNIILDPLLMFGFDMGIQGAGLATASSQIISFLILLSMLFFGKVEARLSLKKFTKSFSDISDIILTGLPSLIRQGVSSISTILLNSHAVVYGDAAVAAMSIVGRTAMFIFAIGLGIGQGFQPVCGFNFGAKEYKRVKKAYLFTGGCAQLLIGVFSIIIIIYAPQTIKLFRNDPKVIEIGVKALRYQCMALFLQPFFVATNMMLQSCGEKFAASFTAFLRNGLYFIPLIMIFPQTFGLTGIQITQPVADILSFTTVIPFAIKFIKKLSALEEEDL